MSQRTVRSPLGEALTWAARIIAAAVVMFLPVIAGTWADGRLGTAFLAHAGLVIGFVAGLAWLVRMTARPHRP